MADVVWFWLAGKTVWSPSYTLALSTLEIGIIKCYINSPFYCTFLNTGLTK